MILFFLNKKFENYVFFADGGHLGFFRTLKLAQVGADYIHFPAQSAFMCVSCDSDPIGIRKVEK